MKKKALILVSIIIFSAFPYSSTMMLDSNNKLSSGASDADISVTALDVTTPSVYINGIPTISPMEHIVRISIINFGGSDANGTLTLSFIDGSTPTEVDSRDISIIAGVQENHIMNWDATLLSGTTGASLLAKWTIDPSETDSDSSNDELSLSSIEINEVENADMLISTLPENGATLARAVWSGTISVVNSGTLPINVTADLILTPQQGGASTSISSTIVQPPLGSLSNPASITDIDITFDATTMQGEYIISGSVQLIGENTASIPISSVTIEFAGFTAILSTPSNRNIDPGGTTLMNFLLQNAGDADFFTVTQSNISGWANIHPNIYTTIEPLQLDSGESAIIQIPVVVPLSASLADSDRITIEVHSIQAGYDLTSFAIVMAGELYQGTLIQNSTNPLGTGYVNVIPGIENCTTIEYELNNTGTAPAQYEINVAMLEAVPYWTIDAPVELTSIILPSDHVIIPVSVCLPELDMPIQPEWKINADLRLHLRVQAIPVSGGLDVIAVTNITVSPTVEIDFNILNTENCPGEYKQTWYCLSDMTADEFTNTNGVSKTILFDIQAKHNLGSVLQGTNSAVVNLQVIGEYPNGEHFPVPPPQTSSAAPLEESRWSVGIVPDVLTLDIGAEPIEGQIGIYQPHLQSTPYPAFGEYRLVIDANTAFSVPNFNGVNLVDQQVETKNNSTTISFNILEKKDAQLYSDIIGTGAPGSSIATTMTLSNTGNAPNQFQVRYSLSQEEAEECNSNSLSPPDGWIVALSGTLFPSATNSNTSVIPSLIDAYPFGDITKYTKTFTITATPPATASADIIHEIWIYVTPKDDPCNILAYAPAQYQLDELIAAELNAGSATAILDRLGSSTIMFELNNTGNSNQTFVLNLENNDTDYLQVSFNEDETISEIEQSIVVDSGSTAIIRVYSKASQSARADASTTFDLILSRNNSELDRQTILVTVNPDHALNLQGSINYAAQPGETIEGTFNLINLGNLLENNVSFNPLLPSEGNVGTWGFIASENISVSPGTDNGVEVKLNITIPNIGPNVMLEAGEVYTIPIQIFSYDFLEFSGDYLTLGMINIVITIEPYFELIVNSSSENMRMVPGQSRTFQYTVLNAGNSPAMVDMDSSLDVSEPLRWQISYPNLPATSFVLQIGETYVITVQITAVASDHYLGESGTFNMIFTSADDAEQSTSFNTPIEIVRVQTDDIILVDPSSSGEEDGLLSCADGSDRCRILRIPWMHVPSLGATDETPVNYNLTVLGITRHIDGELFPEVIWGFYVEDLLLTSSDFSLDFDAVQPYYPGSKFNLKFIIPEKDKLAPGDGWTITFRLMNPNEPNTASVFNVVLSTTTTSDPRIESIRFAENDFFEGTTTTLIIQIKNAGDAIMPLGATVTVSCDGKYLDGYISGFQDVPALAPQESYNATWQISSKSIPWWATSEQVTCMAQLTGTAVGVKGNDLSNDLLSVQLNIVSWEPPSFPINIGSNTWSIPIIAFVSLLLLLFSLYLYRNGIEDFTPSYVHLSAYFAAAGLGALSLTNWFTWLPIICASLTVIFSIRIAWASSSELQAIHNDKKKSLTGARATMAHHDAEAKKTLKELRAIISCSPLTFLIFMLLNPTLSIDTSGIGLMGLLIYVIISPIIVHLVLRFLDKSYGKIYGELGQLELRAMKIKKILATQNVSERFQPKNRLDGGD